MLFSRDTAPPPGAGASPEGGAVAGAGRRPKSRPTTPTSAPAGDGTERSSPARRSGPSSGPSPSARSTRTPGVKPGSIHTDDEWARAKGLGTPIAQGMMSTAYVSTLMTGAVGAGFVAGGTMDVRFLRPVHRDDTLTVTGTVTGFAGDGGQRRVHVVRGGPQPAGRPDARRHGDRDSSDEPARGDVAPPGSRSSTAQVHAYERDHPGTAVGLGPPRTGRGDRRRHGRRHGRRRRRRGDPRLAVDHVPLRPELRRRGARRPSGPVRARGADRSPARRRRGRRGGVDGGPGRGRRPADALDGARGRRGRRGRQPAVRGSRPPRGAAQRAVLGLAAARRRPGRAATRPRRS